MIPGPTNLSERVRRVMALPQVGHVSPSFYEQFKELIQLSRYVFRNEKGIQYVFTGSGTLAMEASVVSTISHGDRTLVLNTGYFGQRFLMINEAHGAKAEQVRYPEGRHADPDDLRKKLTKTKYKAVFMTHVETGSTVLNPIEELVEECNRADVLSIVDSVCGVGGVELNFDRLGADIVLTASQKALAAPPGALLIATSPRILDYFAKRKEPIESYYLNLLKWKPVMDDPKIYLATPAVQVTLALREALLEVREEGIENRWKRHHELGEAFRDGVSESGVDFVAEEGHRADTVTGFWVPEGKAPEIQKQMRSKHNIEVSRGLLENNGKMIRLGHFGNLSMKQMNVVLEALASVLRDLGISKQEKTIQVAKRA